MKRSILRIAAISTLLGLANQGFAASFCVTTGTQLFNALTIAGSNGQDDVIRIVQGTLTGGNTSAFAPLWVYEAQPSDVAAGLNLSGGWNAGCTIQTQNPQLTVLDANHTGAGFDFTNGSGDFLAGTFVVRNLTITRGKAELGDQAAAFHWRINGSATNTLLLENVLVVASQSVLSAAGPVRLRQENSGRVTARNLIINNNNMAASSNYCGMLVEVVGSALAFVSNNSIFNNSCTGQGAGLLVAGAVTLSNNVVVDNTSTAAVFYQMLSPTGTGSAGISLNRNHFGTYYFVGTLASDIGTTTGDPQWTYTGSIATPNPVSVLRNTGNNTPFGGLSSTDYAGNARIVDSTVDRGAIEAATTIVGPTVSPLMPLPGGGTGLPSGLIGTNSTTAITFTATGGVAPNTTSLSCVDDDANVTLSATATQTIAVGNAVQPVVATYANASLDYIWRVTCTVTQTGGSITTYTYDFITPQAGLLGPALQATSPLAGSTTTLPGNQLNQVVTADIIFSAQGGVPNGFTTLSCAPFQAQGQISIASGGSQSIETGATVDFVRVAMTIGNQEKLATVRCIVGRTGDPFVNLDFNFKTNAAVLFANGFEN